MSELYGVTNWDCTFKTYKLQGDWQAALGITIRIPHLSHMSLEGEAKRDWPASIFYQSPWYKEFSYIENHFARLNTALARGKRIARIAVIHPVESMWIKIGNDDVNDEIRKSLDRDFADLTKLLLYNTLDFDYLSEALLPEQCTKSREKRLKVGFCDYDVVVVPDMLTIRDTTLDIIEQFAEDGGKIIFAGSIPHLVNGTQSTRAAELADKCECISNSELLNKLEYLRDIEIKKDNGLYSDNLFYQICEYGHCKWLFISHVNKSDNISREKYTVKITGEYSLTLYDTINGKRFNMPSHIENGYTIFNWNCYSEDSILLCCNDKKTEFAEYKADQEYKTVQRIRKITDYNRTEPNVLLLDYAQCSIDNGEILNREEILRVDNKIRKKLGFPEKTGHDRQPWATEEKETQSITLYYDIYSEISTSVQLGIENPENCCIYLNGAEADNTAVGWYVDKAIKIINLPDIQKGKNELKIEMQYNQKTMLENMYLLGDFGVKLDEDRAVISKERRSLNFGNITAQGMPFYTGNLEYMFTIDIDDSNEYFIHIPKFFAPVIGIYVDGKKRGLIAYAPHRLSLGKLEQGSHEIKVELYGNRYNGFGTLHNANENYVWYGNSSYRTTGEEWTDNYMLRPVGIMSAIEIEKIDNMPK